MTTEPQPAPDGDDLPATLEQAAREELECLWDDLDSALSLVVTGAQWSIKCQQTADRIRALTIHLGACPWMNVPVTVLNSGHYERLHAGWGVPAPVDWSQVPQPTGIPGRYVISGGAAPSGG